jgi:pilus assembly protein CpaB
VKLFIKREDSSNLQHRQNCGICFTNSIRPNSDSAPDNNVKTALAIWGAVVRKSTIVMIGFAVVFGLLAVFIAQSWLNSQAEQRMRSLEANKKAAPTHTIVVAAQPLPFGTELAPQMLREIAWPQDALPNGAFAKIQDMLSAGKRIVLSPVEPNEPVLAVKITGPGQRATLSALVGEGMKAVTVRVNDVEGVGGFVLPGDRVDVVMTRQIDKGAATTEVVLQNARVLAVDQQADERNAKPAVAKAVTLEVDTTGAQKVWLAASVGNLSLVLRRAGDTKAEATRRISLRDLGAPDTPAARDGSVATIVVKRASATQEYTVPVEGTAQQTVGFSGGRKSGR